MLTEEEALAQERAKFREVISEEDRFPPVIAFRNDKEPHVVPMFGELRGIGRRWIVKDITDDHVYILQPEGGPYFDADRELQGQNDELWAKLLEEVDIERVV
jgi:hypothetical protein